jgi:hypothetical protein
MSKKVQTLVDLPEVAELTGAEMARVSGGLTGTPRIGDTGGADAVLKWFTGMIVSPEYQQPETTTPIPPAV